MRVKVKTFGFDKVRDKLGAKAASRLEGAVDLDVGVVTREMAMESARLAPVLTGALQTSIRNSTERQGNMEYIYGSYMPYAQRQNYEHRSKRYFMELGYWHTKRDAMRTISETVRRTVT